jgi:PAS domain S-box-containing protein
VESAWDVLKALPGLVYVYDLRARKNVYVNYNIEDVLGYAQEYLRSLGEDFFPTLVHPDDVEAWYETVLPQYAAADDKAVIENEFRIRHANGEWRWFMTRGRILRRSAGGTPEQVVAVGHDITRRKESERLLDRLLRHATEGLSLIDAQGAVIYSSPNMRNILGLVTDAGTAVEFGYYFVEKVHADDRPRVEAEFRRIMQEPGAGFESPLRAYHADGSLRWLEVSASNLLADPNVGAVVVNYRDITERMRAENQLRYQAKLVENVNEAVIVTDLNYIVQTWNPAAQAIYGWRADEIVGKSLSEHLRTEFVDDDFNSSLRIGHTTGNWHGEVRQQRKDGTSTQILASVSLVTDAAGAPIGWIAINRDISEEKAISQALAQERAMLSQRVEERTTELRAANAELARASRLKDEFLAAVSHEFRTPLQAILGFTENLSEGIIGPVNERQQRYLSLVMDNSQHLLALINDILEFTKTGANPTRLDLSSVAVAALCEASIAVVRSAALRKRQHIALALASHDLIVSADERIIKQILINLLNNAVKFTGEGGAIGLETYTRNGGASLCFTVWDTGIGIAEQDRDRLFQPFVQLDSGLNRQYDGTGLGLALAARLAAAHGGEVTFESTLGVGSRFTLAIPLRRTEHQTQNVPVHG